MSLRFIISGVALYPQIFLGATLRKKQPRIEFFPAHLVCVERGA
jgi:hypothetical protein